MSHFQFQSTEFEDAFPFHFVFDSSLVIQQVGKALRKLAREPLRGKRLDDAFQLVRPPTRLSFEQLSTHENSTIVLAAADDSYRLKGQVLIRANELGVFLGSPWISSLEAIRELKITVADFPLHSFVPDYLMLLQSQKSTMGELERMALGLATKQEELETALREAQSASEAKSDFLASVSHEVRTPLNAIVGFASLLKSEVRDSRAADYLRVLRRASENLEALVEDLLDLSRAEKGELVVKTVGFLLPKLLEDVVDLHSPKAEEIGLALGLEVDSGLPASVVGDPRRLQQVLTNLLGNSLRYTKHGSIVLSVGLDDDPEFVRFVVRDTGPGIAPEMQSEIFERFARGTTTGDGLGLGLSISQSLVETMGGTIGVKSTHGEGAEFSFVLPLAAGGPPTMVHMLELPPDSGKHVVHTPQRLLIAEDNADNRFLVQEYLRETNHSIVFANDGVEALEVFDPGEFDMILVDLQMPRLDGYGTIRALRAIEQARSSRALPILAVSADAYQDSIKRCLEAGATAHLAKPLACDLLLEAIYTYCLESATRAPSPEPEPAEPALAPRIAAMRGRYLANQNDRLRRMNEALGRGDLQTVTSLAHQVKGTAASFGVKALGDSARILEERGLAADEVGAREALESFARVLEAEGLQSN